MVITTFEKFQSRVNDSCFFSSSDESFSQERVASNGAFLPFTTIPPQQLVENIDKRREGRGEPGQLEEEGDGRLMVIFDSAGENGS